MAPVPATSTAVRRNVEASPGSHSYLTTRGPLTVADPTSGASIQLDTSNQRAGNFLVIPGSENHDTLTVVDNRTKKVYELKVENNTVAAVDFAKIRDTDDQGRPAGTGLRLYDPGFQNTAVARSRITYIDGEAGILQYRGYDIEVLAEKSNFLEVSYLLIYGELPTARQFERFHHEVMHHTFVHHNLGQLMRSFNYDAHPMGMFISGISALSTFHPEANPALNGQDMYVNDARMRNKQIFRLLGKAPTLAAFAYRHRIGRPNNLPRNDLSYTANFLYMLDHLSEEEYTPHPVLVRALDVLFILHADHELNCSTAAMRHIGSSRVDPYSAVAGASAALYGPLHGGANEAVVRMLQEIGTVDQIPAFIEAVKARKKKLMGFGHRIYRNHDPRQKIIRRVANEVFEVVGQNPLLKVAQALEQAALKDDYFVKRKLYPNVDFLSGIVYHSLGVPLDYYPVLFALPRIAGWLAHWKESCEEPNGKIWRPRQVYVGEPRRDYVALEDRTATQAKGGDELATLESVASRQANKRSEFATHKHMKASL
ncbi:hypothetical protein IWQ60_005691 [Tieghemiomyces parasiticus]|uniref:Citrate synthase n=1 Tax=Tieghemiomyces parasiticus TaxID=78921 RepID=A0A9W8AE73_9FUNG|nr:hypothetical protein IWQ60_005691 [Tieghemiomyces parasiticus]